jgi:integrase
MPIYKRGPNKYEVRLYGWTIPGRPKAWTVRGSRKEAEAFEAQRRLELAARGPQEYRTAPPFSEFCLGRYRMWAEVQLAESTWRNRKYQLATLIDHFGNRALDRIGPTDIQSYQRARMKAGVGAVKINDDLKVLRAVLNLAKEWGALRALPKIRLLPERKTKGRIKPWSAAEVEALYQAVSAESPDILGMVVLMLNTGLRKGEVLALEWPWVNLDRALLEVQPNPYWRPKDNEPREVPIGEAALPYLLQRPRRHPVYVFPTTRGKRYHSFPQRKFDRARTAAALEGGPHHCRHTYASHFLSERPDLWLLAQVLGHSHTRVTELYSHLLPGHLERARNAVHLPAPMPGPILDPGGGGETVH